VHGRPRVVLVPGLLCDRWLWRAQIAALSRVADVVVADGSRCSSITDMAEAALAAAPGKIALAGHSLGARIVLEAIRLAPDRIERLALLDVGVGPVRPEEEPARMGLVHIAHERGMDAVADAWLPPMVHEPNRADETLMRGLRQMIRRATPASFERQQRALLNRPDAESVLAEIRCPTLVALGRHDAWSTLGKHQKLAGRIPVAKLVVIEDAGHMAPAERPAAVSAALLDWLGMRVGG
jgi:pimeloyl-ACP methyl ester carboxylesterase